MTIQQVDYQTAHARSAIDGIWGRGTLKVARAKYDFDIDGGAVSTITPGASYNATIPDNAVMVGGFINSTTACTSGESATVSVGYGGTNAATAGFLTLTAIASLSDDALIVAIPTPAVPVKMNGEGKITFSIAVAALTAGVIEATILYFVADA